MNFYSKFTFHWEDTSFFPRVCKFLHAPFTFHLTKLNIFNFFSYLSECIFECNKDDIKNDQCKRILCWPASHGAGSQQPVPHWQSCQKKKEDSPCQTAPLLELVRKNILSKSNFMLLFFGKKVINNYMDFVFKRKCNCVGIKNKLSWLTDCQI